MSTFTINTHSTTTNWLTPADRRSNRTNPDRIDRNTEEQPVETAWLPVGFLATGRIPTLREVKDWLGEKPRHFLETLKPITAGGGALTGFGSIIGLFGGNEIIGGALTAFGIVTFIVGALSGPNLEPNIVEIGLHNNNSTVEEGPSTMIISSVDPIELVSHTPNQIFVSPNGTFANVEIVQSEIEFPFAIPLPTLPTAEETFPQPEIEPPLKGQDIASTVKALKKTHSKSDDEITILLKTLRNTKKPKAILPKDFLNTRKDAATKLGEKILNSPLKPSKEKTVLSKLIERITKRIRPDNNELRIHVTNILVEILLKSNLENDAKRIDQIAKGLMAAIVTCSEDLDNYNNRPFQNEVVAILRKTEHPVIQKTLASLEQDGKIT